VETVPEISHQRFPLTLAATLGTMTFPLKALFSNDDIAGVLTPGFLTHSPSTTVRTISVLSHLDLQPPSLDCLPESRTFQD